LEVSSECSGIAKQLQDWVRASKSRNHNEALQIARSAASAAPNCAKAHYFLAVGLSRTGHPGSAIASYERSIQLDDSDSMAFYNLGIALGEIGRADDAITAYRKSIAIRDSYADAYVNLAALLWGKNADDEALELARRAVSPAPGDAVAHGCLAHSLQRKGCLNEAIDEYWATIALDKAHAPAYRGLGICYSILGQFDNAAEKFAEAFRLDPGNPTIRGMKAHHYMTRLQIGNAVRALLGRTKPS